MSADRTEQTKHGIRTRSAKGKVSFALRECPACGDEFADTNGGRQQRIEHFADHAPEDFGLTPMGDRR